MKDSSQPIFQLVPLNTISVTFENVAQVQARGIRPISWCARKKGLSSSCSGVRREREREREVQSDRRETRQLGKRMHVLTGYEVDPGSLRDFNGFRSVANQRANRNINTANVEDHSVTPSYFPSSCPESLLSLLLSTTTAARRCSSESIGYAFS